MLYGICCSTKTFTEEVESMDYIYFANKELANRLIEWIANRFHCIELESSSMKYWSIDAEDDDCMIFVIPYKIDYKDQPIIYKLSITSKDAKSTYNFCDFYTNKKSAEGIVNLINTNSSMYTASIDDIMVIRNEDELNGLKKFLSSDSFIKQWSYFSNIRP